MDVMQDPNSMIHKVNGLWAGLELQSTFQQEVAALLDRSSASFPGAQPVSFAARHIAELKHQDYYVCEKTDGIRYLMYMTRDDDQDIHYLIDRKNNYYYVANLHFPHHEDKSFNRFHSDTILDGELVEERYPDRPPVIKYLVFDCLVIDKNSLMNRPLDKRLAYFKSHILEPYKAMYRQQPERPRPPFLVEDKSTEFSYGLEKMFKEIIPKVKQLHGNDGLIFTCRNTPYKTGTDDHILKWKPPEDNTIDFLLHIVWPKLDLDAGDHEQYLEEDVLAFPDKFELFVYHGRDNDYRHFADMYVTPQEWEKMKALHKPLQYSVVECYLEPPEANGHNPNGHVTHDRRWRYYRLRDDKTHGNHASVVDSVMESIDDRVSEDDLLNAANEIRSAWKKRDAEAKEAQKRQQEEARRRQGSRG